MKKALRTVLLFGLIGTVLGGVLGYITATSGVCQVFSEDPDATCYKMFGRYVSEITYYALVEPFKGLAIGVGVGLLVVMGRGIWRRLRLAPA
jgi:hypothetical protein